MMCLRDTSLASKSSRVTGLWCLCKMFPCDYYLDHYHTAGSEILVMYSFSLWHYPHARWTYHWTYHPHACLAYPQLLCLFRHTNTSAEQHCLCLYIFLLTTSSRTSVLCAAFMPWTWTNSPKSLSQVKELVGLAFNTTLVFVHFSANHFFPYFGALHCIHAASSTGHMQSSTNWATAARIVLFTSWVFVYMY